MSTEHDRHPGTAFAVTPVGMMGRPRKSAAQAELPSALAELHRCILRAFLTSGSAPQAADLDRLAGRLGLDPAAAIRRLAEADLVHVDPVTGAVRSAYPFSGLPTPHVVLIDGAPSLYAMCAIDALGIPLMAGRDGMISSESPATGAAITVERRAGIWRWQPQTAVVLIASTGDAGPSARCTCPFISFYGTAEEAAAHLRDSPLTTGRIVSQEDAVGAAHTEFGRLLAG
jgi:Alkylmercury lyase